RVLNLDDCGVIVRRNLFRIEADFFEEAFCWCRRLELSSFQQSGGLVEDLDNYHLKELRCSAQCLKLMLRIFQEVDQERDCKENANIFSQGIAFAITSYEGYSSWHMMYTSYTLIEQGGPKEDLCMIAFQPQGVFVWEGAEVVHLQAEETKLEYSRNIVTNSRETPSWREIISLTVLVKLASFTFTKTVRLTDMKMIPVSMSNMQINTKFVNNLQPELSRFVTAAKQARDLHSVNFDQLYAFDREYLGSDHNLA
nr:integrase, catalytic region, zinc finger, CCHC-type, peptidase aspartic, catalytic [Tanacetum cinerariifolium]